MSKVSGKGTRRRFRTPVLSIGLSYEPWLGAGRQKSLRYDVIYPQNARKHQIKALVGLSQSLLRTYGYASLFMYHFIDLAPLIPRNQDTSISHFIIIRVLKRLINALLVYFVIKCFIIMHGHPRK